MILAVEEDLPLGLLRADITRSRNGVVVEELRAVMVLRDASYGQYLAWHPIVEKRVGKKLPHPSPHSRFCLVEECYG